MYHILTTENVSIIMLLKTKTKNFCHVQVIFIIFGGNFVSFIDSSSIVSVFLHQNRSYLLELRGSPLSKHDNPNFK